MTKGNKDKAGVVVRLGGRHCILRPNTHAVTPQQQPEKKGREGKSSHKIMKTLKYINKTFKQRHGRNCETKKWKEGINICARV